MFNGLMLEVAPAVRVFHPEASRCPLPSIILTMLSHQVLLDGTVAREKGRMKRDESALSHINAADV